MKIYKGAYYEKKAAHVLQQKGYDILQHNYRHSHVEVDLICSKPSQKLLVFVEVKFRRWHAHYNAYATISRQKKRNIQRAAEAFLQALEGGKDYYCRYDVIIIISDGKQERLEHIEGAYIL